MPGHYTSSFVSRGHGLAEVIDRRISAPQSGFGECRREHCRTSAKRGTVAEKTTPARRLTVNRKPLRNHGSLAQPATSENGFYSAAGHLAQSDRLPYGCHASRQKPRYLPRSFTWGTDPR